MKLRHLLTRPLPRRASSLFCVFTVVFTFYSYQWLTNLHEDDAEIYRQPVKPRLRQQHQVERGSWFKYPQENIIQKKRYTNTGYKIIPTMLLDKQGINVNGVNSSHGVWPNKQYPWDDRITAQLAHIPAAATDEQKKPFYQQNLKTVLFWNAAGVMEGRQRLLDDRCPVSQCYLSRNRRLLEQADAVVFNNLMPRGLNKRKGQIWIFFTLESPMYTHNLAEFSGLVNWTATYRRDSEIVAPYEKYVPYREGILSQPQTKNYAVGKTKLIAWFVSNCGAKSGRGKIAAQLSKYIQVDIFGRCGKYSCRKGQQKCFEMLDKDYKFYLSFENSNCRDYITEKFYLNALQHDIVPIVFGASRADYERSVPPHSFIHVEDFRNLQQLANYLKKLDKNEELYNEYFKWKETGKFINTYFYCRLCAMMWDQTKETWYDDLNEWWRGKGICLKRNEQYWKRTW